MARTRKDKEGGLQNPTLDKLDGLPFTKVADLKEAQDKIEQRVFENLEEASKTMKVMKKHYPHLLSPLRAGIKASYSGENPNGLGHGYLTEDDLVKVDLDKNLQSDNKPELTECVIRGISSSIFKSYYDAIGLHRDSFKGPSEAGSK